jgi:hypothetical protein
MMKPISVLYKYEGRARGENIHTRHHIKP